MPDMIVAKSSGNGQGFEPHPIAQCVVACVDVIDLGEKVEQFEQNPAKIVHKAALVYQSEEVNAEGKPYEVTTEFTVSMHERAGLRKLLSAWRGKPYSEEEALAGAPLHKLVGVYGFASIIHKTSGAGRTYAKIDSLMPLPKRMEKFPLGEYERAPYWAERKAEYAAGVAKFRGVTTSFDEKPEALEEESDDIPF